LCRKAVCCVHIVGMLMMSTACAVGMPIMME
jgi:hypothetical protein